MQRDRGFADVGDAQWPLPVIRGRAEGANPGSIATGWVELARQAFSLRAWGLWAPALAAPGRAEKPSYSILSLASRTTLPHFSISDLIRAPNSSGALATGTKPSVASFSFTSGCATAFAISFCSNSTISFGVAAGTTKPVNVSES